MQEKFMPKEQIAEFIQESHLFKQFTKNMRDKLQKTFELETCNYGEPLIFQGLPVDSLILIISGQATITHFIEKDT